MGEKVDRLESVELKVIALENKIDAVAADLKAHRADTQSASWGVSGERGLSKVNSKHLPPEMFLRIIGQQDYSG